MKGFFKKLVTRLQNRNVLISIFSGILLILTNTGVINVDKVDHLNTIFNTILSVLITLGIVSDPESHVKK
jgi:uncharacterized membrane protein